MRVLVALNDNDNSKEERVAYTAESGQKSDYDSRILHAYNVDNVMSLSDEFDEKQMVYMDIVGERCYSLAVTVADQEAGDNLVRKLCEAGYLDLTSSDVCRVSFEQQGRFQLL